MAGRCLVFISLMKFATAVSFVQHRIDHKGSLARPMLRLNIQWRSRDAQGPWGLSKIRAPLLSSPQVMHKSFSLQSLWRATLCAQKPGSPQELSLPYPTSVTPLVACVCNKWTILHKAFLMVLYLVQRLVHWIAVSGVCNNSRSTNGNLHLFKFLKNFLLCHFERQFKIPNQEGAVLKLKGVGY